MTDAAKVPFLTKASYGFGAIAYGIKNNGFDYFFLLFYSQVLGFDAGLVGAALTTALIFDAMSDPLVGYFSDNLHSRWGRRHPFMYFAAIPVSVSYFFIWNPPAELDGPFAFIYIASLAVFVRLLITMYEVPSSALVAEMTDDYDERTSMLSYRYFFGWAGGALMGSFALAFLLVPTEEIANGMFNVDGFSRMGLVASLFMFLAILVSALGTHSFIPRLKKPPARTPFTFKRVYGDLFQTLATRSFLALFLSALFGSVATGVSAGLNFYINSYFWEFSNQQISLLSISLVASAAIGSMIAPVVSRRLGKKRGAIVVGVLAFTVAPLAVVLRLFGVMPENGSDTLFPIILTITIFDWGLIIGFQTLMAAMIADLVEDSERKTKRRSEGVFFSAITFTRKLVQGVGIVTATIILSAAQFPAGVMPGDVPEESLSTLGGLYAPTLFALWMVMIWCLSFYKIDRQAHEENLRMIKEDQKSSSVST